MLNYVWGILMIVSVICGMITGNISQVSNAVLEGAAQGVTLCITMMSSLILWGGFTAIMERSGLSHWLGVVLGPVIRWLFPDLKQHPKARTAIAMNIAANVLGLGNGATPLGLKAMQELQKINNLSSYASNSMVTFVVLNSVSVQIIPTSLLMIRKQLGAETPTDVLTAVWFASVLSAMVGVGMALVMNRKKGNEFG